MRTLKIALAVAALTLLPAALAGAEECGPRDINGKKYTCCKKSVTNTGKIECDAKGKKEGEAIKCGTKIETSYECTEQVADKKTDKKPEAKK